MLHTFYDVTLGGEHHDEIEVDLPTHREVCGTCNGYGKHSRHIGAITAEDRDRDWSEDEFDSYMSGAYDRTCEECKGQKVIDVPTWGAVDPVLVTAYEREMHEREWDRRTIMREMGWIR